MKLTNYDLLAKKTLKRQNSKINTYVFTYDT